MENEFNKVIELYKEETKKNCYMIVLADGEPSILDDKIGGIPYLPVGEEYPKDEEGNYLALLLQVNLKNIELNGYPKKGILEIFTDANVDYPCQYAIKYFDEGLEYQTELPNVDMSNYIVENSYKINLIKDVCYMPFNDYRFFETLTPIINKVFGTSLRYYSEVDDYFGSFEWSDKLFAECENPLIMIGGYADFNQEDPRDGLPGYYDECLFKLDSWADLDIFNIGDAGKFFVLISQTDIENCNFDDVIVDWDSC